MSEVENVVFPSTYEEFSTMGASLDALLNISTLHESCCVKQQQQQQQSTYLLSYKALKNLYGLSTSKLSKNEESSSTDVPFAPSSSSSASTRAK